MTSILFVGDVHAKLVELHDILNRNPDDQLIIQVGDMGLGFNQIPEYDRNFWFIRGNHDSPELSRKHKNYLGDYGVIDVGVTTIGFVSGAHSIDVSDRIPGLSWWSDEELPESEFKTIVDLFIEKKPEIIVSHDCPYAIYEHVCDGCKRTRTNSLLNILFNAYQPRFWIFGHHHRGAERFVNGTYFICLNELQVKELNFS